MRIHDTLNQALLRIGVSQEVAESTGEAGAVASCRYLREQLLFIIRTGQVYRFEDYLKGLDLGRAAHPSAASSLLREGAPQRASLLLLRALDETNEPEPKRLILVLIATLHFIAETGQYDALDDYLLHYPLRVRLMRVCPTLRHMGSAKSFDIRFAASVPLVRPRVLPWPPSPPRMPPAQETLVPAQLEKYPLLDDSEVTLNAFIGNTQIGSISVHLVTPPARPARPALPPRSSPRAPFLHALSLGSGEALKGNRFVIAALALYVRPETDNTSLTVFLSGGGGSQSRQDSEKASHPR